MKIEPSVQRQRYMEGKIDHQEYYTWLADYIGVGRDHLPVSLERIKASKDPNYNDIPLQRWDADHFSIRRLAYLAGIKSWSMCETVCVLKAVARREAAVKQVGKALEDAYPFGYTSGDNEP